MRRFKQLAWAVPGIFLASTIYACGSSGGADGADGSGADGSGQGGSSSSDSNGDGGTSASNGGSSSGGGTTGAGGIGLNPIPGGGDNSAPLKPGCGPETAHDCVAPGGECNPDSQLPEDHEVTDAGAVCFYGEGLEDPSATVEYITEVLNGVEYVHIRVTFDPNFVDTVYGECSADTGWNPNRPHTFKDLHGSDHVELMLYNCSDDLSLHFTVDFIDDADTPCGFGSAGVTGGDGSIIVGSEEDFLAVTTSLDRNMNGCGYCDDTQSPCTDETYASSDDAPEWDFRMVYEVWIRADAFGDAGFCTTDINYVHASPAKGDSDTILVEPDDCPPPDDDCPVNYELYLTSEGEYWCVGPPDDGECPAGYELDLTSEGELCIPTGNQ